MWKNLLLLLVSLVLAGVLLESAVRARFPENSMEERVETAYFRDGIGMLKTPGQTARNTQACFAIPEIRFNSLGFRDNEVSSGEAVAIGILGDSAMEAMQVPEGEYTAALVEKMLGHPVLNMSIGGANTVKELQIYRQLMALYQPKIVVLVITSANDVLDNGCGTIDVANAASGLPPFTGACGTIVDGQAVYRVPTLPAEEKPTALPSVSPGGRFDFVDFLRRDCRSCRMINDVLKGTVGISLSPTTVTEAGAYSSGFSQYLPLESLDSDTQGLWRESWMVTEAALIQLRDEVASNHGRLIVLLPPNNMLVSRDWRQEFRTLYGFPPKAEFDPARPGRQLRALMERHSIPLLDLESVLLEYRDRHRLDFPYFSFRCDGHWNPLGHFVVASWLTEMLVERGHVAVSDPAAFVRARQRERDQPPRAILGAEAYKGLYDRGIFKGRSMVSSYQPQ